MTKAKILIVENEAIVALDIKNSLKKLGYSVTGIMTSGEDAIKKTEEHNPDLVLMDIKLNGKMDGIEAAAIIRSRFATPVIFLTAYADKEKLERAKLMIPFGYILKPFQDRNLKITIEMALYAGKVTAEHKQAEDALQESEERFRLAFENANDGVCLVDTEGNLVRVNNRMSEIFGYSKKELESMTVNDIAHPEDKDISPKFIEKSLSGEVKSTVFEKRYFHKQGHIIMGQVSSSIVKDAKGDDSYFISHVQDITQRKKADEALKESEERYRSMMESMKDHAYICSPELRIEYMNPAMVDRIGCDATGEICYKAIYGRDEKCSWCVFDKVEQNEYFEYEVADPKDNRYYSVANSPISHTDGTVSKLTVFHDITDIIAIEENLRQAQKMESIGTLTGGIAHDFNNILGIIIGNTELALEDVLEGSPAYFNLEEIKTASLRATNIVGQLVNFSRETNQKLQPIEIVSVIKDALKFLRSTIPATIDIQQDIPTTDEIILGDPTQINQVMMNLCINASQAMGQTIGNIRVNVEKVILDDNSTKDYPDLSSGKHVRITVSDTGPGIDPKIINRIFDPYFTTREVGKGSGMGLAVVHGIVKNHSGAILVESKPGKGATFKMLFPLAEGKVAVREEIIQEVPKGSKTILFVDDEISIVKMTQKMLEHLGYKVETAMIPQDALEQFRLNPDHFDLVITDMTMPQMTGVELSEKIMDIRTDIPIIICTGYSAFIDEKKAQELGLAAYVMKPIKMSQIAQTIQKVLDKK